MFLRIAHFQVHHREFFRDFNLRRIKLPTLAEISGLSFRYWIRLILKSREKPELDVCAIEKPAFMEQRKPLPSDFSVPCFMVRE